MTRAQANRHYRAIERKRVRLERKFFGQLRAFLRRETQAISDSIRQNPLYVLEELDAVLEPIDLEPIYRAMYMDAVEAFKIRNPETVIKAEPIGEAWNTVVNQHMLSYGINRITEIRRTTKNMTLKNLQPILEQGVKQGLPISEIAREMQKKLAEYAPNAERYRATRIARTEIVGASNWAAEKSVEVSGIGDMVLKRWLPALQDNTRDAHLAMIDHPAIPMDEMFNVGGELMAYPGDSNASVGQVANCRCVLVFERKV